MTGHDHSKVSVVPNDFSAHLNMSKSIFGMGSSSLLVDQGSKPSGIFSVASDRFIPCRPDEDQTFCGVQKFYHEENLLLSKQAKKQQREVRRQNRDSDDEETRSRDSSRSDSADSRDSHASNDEREERSTHATRQQRLNYNNML